ncbi:hypothetical protein ES703_103173 [subsurface metagenome]
MEKKTFSRDISSWSNDFGYTIEGDYLVIRVYNISSTSQTTTLTFFDKISIKDVKIVNFLEEAPKHEIKVKINYFNNNLLEIALEPHVIATFKVNLEFIK